MKKTAKILNYFLYISLIGIGLIIGIAIRHYYSLPLSETFNIIDLATLVTTVFLAIYIPQVLDKRLQITRDKKELIEKRIVELQALYRKINLITQEDNNITQKDYLAINNTLDITQHKLETIATLLNYSKLDIPFSNDIEKIKALNISHKEVFQSLKKQNGEYIETSDIQANEEILYNQIDQATSLLLFKISDA